MGTGWSRDRKLYILAFDHRGSFTSASASRGIRPEQLERIADGKH